MPCNDHQPLCGEGSTTNNDVLEGHDTAASSSTNGNVEPTIEERRVSICASVENAQSLPQTGQHEHKNNSSSRSRAMSSRSINLQSIALPGEELVSSPDNENCVTMESCQLFLTQYRLIIVSHNQNAMCAIPLTGVDSLEAKDIVGLQISCKDGRIIKFRAENSEMACAWYKKLMQKTCIARDLSNIFAFKFYSENVKEKFPSIWLRKEAKKLSAFDQLRHEFLRLKLNENNWRISDVNETFEVCPTYPQYLIVPSSIKSDEELKQMSFGRYYRRFPTLVWRNRRNSAVLLRSSQPSIGFFGMSNDKDVTLYDRIRAAISTDPNYKFLIVDARSYTAAWANRAKGGGFEGADTYINAEVVFMGLPNIHNIRYSFLQLRQLLNAGTDPNTYLQTLQSTLWLQNIGQLFTATERCLNSLCFEGTSVLVHCSDGWDRTTQIVSLCMLIADPYYRTFDGFEMLIQRQWVEFGHKFGDRGGVLNSDDNEKSPVFLQFLDCVFQLWMKNSNLFEFNRRYLLKLMQHTFSGLFGTFLFNSIRDAIKNGYDPYDSDEHKQKCYQIWAFLGKHNPEFRNPAYNGTNKMMLEYPKIVPDLVLWKEAYCCTAEQSMINNPDDSMHQSNGTGSTQDITSDKASSTLSRSQSAASLTSLHEQNQPNYSTSNCNNFLHSNGTTTPGMGNLSVKLNESCSIGSIYSTSTWQGQPKLDVDGLSMFPLQYEDYVRRRILELERQVCQHQQQACKFAMTATAAQNMRDGYMNMNGKLPNGTTAAEGLGNGTTRRIRNESVESSFEVVNCDRLKHNSSSSLTSVFQPSSYSSNSTILSDYTPVNNGICKNGTLQEGIETEQMDGNGTDGLEMLHSRS